MMSPIVMEPKLSIGDLESSTLKLLQKSGPLSQAQICVTLNANEADILNAVAGLKDQGLVRRDFNEPYQIEDDASTHVYSVCVFKLPDFKTLLRNLTGKR